MVCFWAGLPVYRIWDGDLLPFNRYFSELYLPPIETQIIDPGAKHEPPAETADSIGTVNELQLEEANNQVKISSPVAPVTMELTNGTDCHGQSTC